MVRERPESVFVERQAVCPCHVFLEPVLNLQISRPIYPEKEEKVQKIKFPRRTNGNRASFGTESQFLQTYNQT